MANKKSTFEVQQAEHSTKVVIRGDISVLNPREQERLTSIQKRVDNNSKHLSYWEKVLNHEVDHEMAISGKTEGLVSSLRLRQDYLNDRLSTMSKKLKIKVASISVASQDTIRGTLGESIPCYYDESLRGHIVPLDQVVAREDSKTLAEHLIAKGVGISYIESESVLVLGSPDEVKAIKEELKHYKKGADSPQEDLDYDEVPEGFLPL
jgi:hypothetical protein